jgi:hypothetical protein
MIGGSVEASVSIDGSWIVVIRHSVSASQSIPTSKQFVRRESGIKRKTKLMNDFLSRIGVKNWNPSIQRDASSLAQSKKPANSDHLKILSLGAERLQPTPHFPLG